MSLKRALICKVIFFLLSHSMDLVSSKVLFTTHTLGSVISCCKLRSAQFEVGVTSFTTHAPPLYVCVRGRGIRNCTCVCVCVCPDLTQTTRNFISPPVYGNYFLGTMTLSYFTDINLRQSPVLVSLRLLVFGRLCIP